MSYSITVNIETQGSATSTLSVAKYVKALETNPTSIEAESTATLDFTADGIYFTLLKAKALAAKVSGATYASWSSVEPFTAGKLTISNPTDNVIVTLRAKVEVNPQEVTRPFLIQKTFPVDTRLVLSKQEMCQVVDTQMPEIYFALCKDDGHFYLYNKKNEISETTGKFIAISDTFESTNRIDGGEVEAV